MLRRILIPLDRSPYTAAAMEYGCFIAKGHDAEVTGLVILDIPGIEKSVGPVPMGGLYYAEKLEEQKKQDAEEHIKTLLEKFKEKCQNEGVAHREAEHQGAPSERIIHDSIFYDLVIMGMQTYFHFETTDKPGDSMERVLNHTITPILAVPDHFQPKAKRNVLIAFNGSLPSARALQGFAHLIKASAFETDIILLMSDADSEVATPYLNEAEAYLRAHSFGDIKKEWTSQDIIQSMKEKYLAWTDLTVLGVHSKKGLLDFMMGSLSQYLIKEANKPLFLGQ